MGAEEEKPGRSQRLLCQVFWSEEQSKMTVAAEERSRQMIRRNGAVLTRQYGQQEGRNPHAVALTSAR